MNNLGEKRNSEKVSIDTGWAGPGIETWPEVDDYVMWRSARENPRRHLECNIPEMAASPFCGKGYHNG